MDVESIGKIIDQINIVRRESLIMERPDNQNVISKGSLNTEVYMKLESLLHALYAIVV